MAKLLTNIPTSVTEYPKSFKRQGAFPLDAYSVFYATADKTALEAAQDYAANNGIAYVGQTLAVVTTDAENASVVRDVTFYVIADANGTLQEVGKATNGDGNSITLEDGKLSLTSFNTAAPGTLPQKSPVFKTDAEGNATAEVDHYELKWVGIDAIVEGDGNTKTVVEAAAGSAITVTTQKAEESDTYTYTLDVVVPDVPEYSISMETTETGIKYQLTKDNIITGDAIEVPDLSDRIGKAEQDIADNTAKFAQYSTTEQIDTKIATEIAANNITINASILEVNTAVTNEATRAKVREDEIAGLVTGNDAAIKKNAQDIASINSALTAALDNNSEGLDSIKELALWIDEHDTEVLPIVNQNKADIEVLNGEANVPGSVKNTVNIAIAALPTATAERAGLVKASAEVTVDSNGVLGVGVISTDKLVNGNDTLVLSGGTA